MDHQDLNKEQFLLGYPFNTAKFYDLKSKDIGRTTMFTHEEVIEAKEKVVETLKKEGLDQYISELKLMDNGNSERTIAVFVFFTSDIPNILQTEGKKEGRVFYLKGGEIISILSY